MTERQITEAIEQIARLRADNKVLKEHVKHLDQGLKQVQQYCNKLMGKRFFDV